jgi:hypothetical protein
VAHRVYLLSAVLGAAGVGLLYWIRLMPIGTSQAEWRARLTAGFSALLFAFSRTFWSQTGIAEVKHGGEVSSSPGAPSRC